VLPDLSNNDSKSQSARAGSLASAAKFSHTKFVVCAFVVWPFLSILLIFAFDSQFLLILRENEQE
jgi:hypothetical protein